MGLEKLLSHRNSCIMNGPKELFISIRIKWLMKNSAIINCETVARLVDRLYVYDNSVNDRDAQLQFRLKNGKLEKMYVSELPDWAKNIIPKE